MKEISENVKAIDVVRQMVADGQVSKDVAEKYFPELKESEDEKIRKEIIRIIKNATNSKSKQQKWYISWLEKQGEKELDPRYIILDKLIEADDIYQMSVNDAMVEEAKNKAIEALSKLEISKLLGLEKQGEQILANIAKTCKDEQKPAETVKWSPQEESCICQLESLVKEQWRQAERVHNSVNIKKMSELMFFLKTLNSNKKPQEIISAEAKEAVYNKSAWSEEDEREIEHCIDFLNHPDMIRTTPTVVKGCKNWLKSLKDRYTWKPSDEQIGALEHFVRSIAESGFASPYDSNTKLVYSLFNDLKKLKL